MNNKTGTIKLLSIIGIFASLIMLVMMAIYYLPLLDAPDAEIESRIIFVSTFILQSYCFIFSIYTAIQTKALVWVKEQTD
jgi:hypothetical protein